MEVLSELIVASARSGKDRHVQPNQVADQILRRTPTSRGRFSTGAICVVLPISFVLCDRAMERCAPASRQARRGGVAPPSPMRPSRMRPAP
ncbi:hypothetical protein [Lysobacter gummosus]|uniref:hypothetical protein n=1 Tax=Lysobacter gummosus TaxID=262324 RepID=UPI0036403F5F